jgi:hypothetical protein
VPSDSGARLLARESRRSLRDVYRRMSAASRAQRRPGFWANLTTNFQQRSGRR